MAKAMILSVGGSPDVQIASLRHHKPETVCFYASQESIDRVAETKQAIDHRIKDHKVIVPDIADLTGCYQKAMECAAFLEEQGLSPNEILVDLTGGTKVMSAAVTLLAISKGYSITYTSGEERDRNGVGMVISGSEQVFEQVNPWEALAIDERRKAALYANSFQFDAALAAFSAALSKAQQPALRRYLRGVISAITAYAAWDRFQHGEATDPLKTGITELESYAEITGDAAVRELVEGLQTNLAFLNQLREKSRGFKELANGHLLDLLANAWRRGREGRYDDAVARLYRSLELAAQLALKKYSIDTGDVRLEQIPEPIRDEYQRKYSSKGKIKIPLEASLRLLEELRDELGERYSSHGTELRKILDSRNSSILAHGSQPIKQSTFEKFFTIVLEFAGVDKNQLPSFPHWPD